MTGDQQSPSKPASLTLGGEGTEGEVEVTHSGSARTLGLTGGNANHLPDTATRDAIPHEALVTVGVELTHVSRQLQQHSNEGG